MAEPPHQKVRNFNKIDIKILSWSNPLQITETGNCCENSKSGRHHCTRECRIQFRACLVPNERLSSFSASELPRDITPPPHNLPIDFDYSSSLNSASGPQESLDYGLNSARMPINHCSLLTNKKLIKTTKSLHHATRQLHDEPEILSLEMGDAGSTIQYGFGVIVEALRVENRFDSRGK